MIQHHDKLGKEISLNEYVAIPCGTHIEVGRVIKLTNKMVNLEVVRPNWVVVWRKYPNDLIVLGQTPELTMYVLKGSQ